VHCELLLGGDVLKTQRKLWIDIKQLRAERGLLQREAAEMLGVSRAHLSALENNARDISMSMMMNIINVFNVEYEDFWEKVD